MLHQVRKILRKNNRKVLLACFGSEEEINDEYLAMINHVENVDSYKWQCNDVTEWDTRFRTIFQQLTDRILRAMGCPEWLRSWFLLFRTKWKMIMMTKEGRDWLTSIEKQFSGNPFTICENTICNMLWFTRSQEMKNLRK